MTSDKEPLIEWNAQSIKRLVVITLAVFGAILIIGRILDHIELESWIKRSATWKASPGEITNLSMYKTDGLLHLLGASWYPVVHYTYRDGDSIESGNTIGQPNIICASKEEATAYLQNFKVGNKVTVYFDRQLIHKSCLVKGTRLTKETKIPQAN